MGLSQIIVFGVSWSKQDVLDHSTKSAERFYPVCFWKVAKFTVLVVMHYVHEKKKQFGVQEFLTLAETLVLDLRITKKKNLEKLGV